MAGHTLAAPRTQAVLHSFRNLRVERSPLGLPAELLDSPLGSSAARNPAEYTAAASDSQGVRSARCFLARNRHRRARARVLWVWA